ncbi:MAG: peptidylprolyl isomerase [Bacteroidaceae bacterium]
MKRMVMAMALLCGASALRAQEDPVLMRINGAPVTRSEFEYNYNKNNSDEVIDKKTVDEYVDLFVNYKLKVLAALDDRLDTLTSFQKEFRMYRDQQIRPLLVPETRMDEECVRYYDMMKANLQGHQLLQPSHIFLRVKQKATKEEQEAVGARMDSVYKALQEGADFAELAKKVSEDPQTAVRGGVLPWIGPNQTLKEFEDVAYSLEVGSYSQPFLSTVGYHIVKLMDKKDLEPFNELKPNIERFLESQGLRDRLAMQALDSIAAAGGTPKTVEEILEEETARLCAKDNNLKYLVQEYHDGLLLFEECSRNVWEPATKDTLGIEDYFKRNKKKYSWDVPHFDGMVYYCRDKKDVKAVRKAIRKQPDSQWTSIVRQQFNKDSVSVKMEKRLFKQGENANVDVVALKVKGAEPKPIEGFPYMAVVGEKLKKGPERWTQVSAAVVADYQRLREEEFVARLREKYTVEVDKEVLATVNKH